MNYLSKFPMLQDALMMPHFIRLRFPQSNEAGCVFKLTVAIFNIY